MNTLQVGYVSTCSLLNGHSAEYIAAVGYVSTCRLLNGSGLMGWWTIIPLTTIAIQLNTLQVGYVSTCRLLT